VANGRVLGRFELGLGVVGLLALTLAYAVVVGWDPWPAVQAWLDRSRTLAKPEPQWSVTVDNQPSSAVVARGVVVIAMGDEVSGHLLGDGARQWTRSVSWSGVAGLGLGSVVVAGKTGGRGYDVLDPATGEPKWSDQTAIGVWTFTNLVIGVACPQDFTCVLTARTPESGNPRWQATLNGNGRPLSGINRPLVGVRAMGPGNPAPQPVPPVLGFRLDEDVQVIGTGHGARLHRYRSNVTTRVTVVGDRAVLTSGTFRDDACRRHVEGRDPGGDRPVWRLDGYDLHTSSGLGCDQRSNPLGGGGLLAAISGDDRDVLLDPDTGKEVYRAGPGERLVNTNGRLALVRTSDRKNLVAVDLDSRRTIWTRPAGRTVTVAMGPTVVVFLDPDGHTVTAVSSTGAVLASVTSDATVLGYADHGLIVHSGRQVGLISYGGRA
jgi:hypothetical protein